MTADDSASPTTAEAAGETAAETAGRDGANELARELLDVTLAANPLGASLLGLPGHDDALPDLTRAAEDRTAAALAALAVRADAMPGAGLSETDLQTVEMVRHVAATGSEVLGLRTAEYTITDLYIAPIAGLVESLSQIPLGTPERAAGYLARLERVPEYAAAAAGRHRDGVAAGRVPVARLVRGAIAHVGRVLADADLGGLRVDVAPGVETPDGFAARRDELLDDTVRPALARYREALDVDVLPAARDDERVGLCWLPDGGEAYRVLAREHTSTDRTPEDLHRTGLDVVAALAAEYAEVGGRFFGTADLAEIFARLRDDPALRYRDAGDMLDTARAAIARAEAASPGWFGRLPASTCRVEPVPAAAAPGAPPAYYLPPAVDGSRPGTYFLNTHEPTERARHMAESVAFHEAVPGHHFQLALAQERTDLPMARRVLVDTAYVEGWGLYSERLADEMGLYSDDVALLGMLAADSMRAARLVVDTGMHALGWSRGQAIEWMGRNTPLPPLEVGTEIDRYIAYPGQALAYMVGRIELLALRARATERLGDAFDVRAFHDLVLGGGALPLAVLGRVVGRWVDRGTAPGVAPEAAQRAVQA